MKRLRSPLGLLALALLAAAPGALAQSGRGYLMPRATEARVAYPANHAPGGVHVLTVLPDGSVGCDIATEAQLGAFRSAEEAGGPVRLTPLPSLNRGTTAFQIVIRATDQLLSNPEALLSFRRAAARWEQVIQTPIQTVIDLDFGPNRFNSGPFGPNILASANSANQFVGNGAGPAEVKTAILARASGPADAALVAAIPVPTPSTFDVPLARAIGGLINLQALGFRDATVDPETAAFGAVPNIGFNSAFAYDFNPNDGISSGRTDFDAVVVHEIGHALGFTSAIGSATAGNPDFTIWDLYRVRPEAVTPGEPYTDGQGWEVAPRVITPGPPSQTGVQVMFTGDAEYETSTATGGRLGGDGQQASHWRADEFNGPQGTIGIMDPTISSGVRDTIRVPDLRALELFGYLIDTQPSTAVAALSVGGEPQNIDFLTPTFRRALPVTGGSFAVVLQNIGTGNALEYALEVVIDSVQIIPPALTPSVTISSESGSVAPGESVNLTLAVTGVPSGAVIVGRLVLRTNDRQRSFSEVPFQISLGNPGVGPVDGTMAMVTGRSGAVAEADLSFRNTGDAPLAYVRVLEPAASDPRTADVAFEGAEPSLTGVSTDEAEAGDVDASQAAAGAGQYDIDGPSTLRLFDLAQLPNGDVVAVDGGNPSVTTLYVVSPDLTTLRATITSTLALGTVSGVAYNDASQSLWVMSQNSGTIREITIDGSQFSLAGPEVRTEVPPFGLDYSSGLGVFFYSGFDSDMLYAVTPDGRRVPGYPVQVEGRRIGATNSPGLSITEGLLEMSTRSSRSLQAGQFGRTVVGSTEFSLTTVAYGIKRSRLDPNGAFYVASRTSGGRASILLLDPPDLPAGVGTPIKAAVPFLSTDLLAPGATETLPIRVDGRSFSEGSVPSEVVFLTNSPSNRVMTLPVLITVLPVAGEAGPETALDGATTRPNPVRGVARVSVTLSSAETVTVGVYNTLGQRVAVLADATPMAAGETLLTLPTGQFAAGVYVVRVQAGASVSTHKVTVIR